MISEPVPVDRIAEIPSGGPLGQGELDVGAMKLSSGEAQHALQA